MSDEVGNFLPESEGLSRSATSAGNPSQVRRSQLKSLYNSVLRSCIDTHDPVLPSGHETCSFPRPVIAPPMWRENGGPQKMRIASDGYIDLRDPRRVRTPGYYDHGLDPVPEGEAIAFLLSHSFRGHRRIVRPLSLAERKRIRLALWADSVSERMTLVDRVWRSITEPVAGSAAKKEPQLVQVVRYGDWAYPLYFDGDVTRVIPLSGTPLAEVPQEMVFELDLERKTA
jgi:hypothetical protein